MNGITIMVPTLSTFAGIVSGIIVLWVARKSVRRLKKFMQRRQDATLKRIEDIHAKKAGIRDRLNALFPSPWNEAYNELVRIQATDVVELPKGDSCKNPKARIFLKHWLSEQKNLPRLSRDAVHKLACLLTFEYCDRWDECLIILDPYTDEIQSLEKTARLAKENAEKEEIEKKKALFRYPWSLAYETCSDSDTYEGAQFWFKKWIREQSLSLPTISVEAAEELIFMVVGEDNDEDYREYFALIAPHLDTGYALLRDVSDYNLEQQLPREWFEFWKEIKDYPSRRSLFLDKCAKYSEKSPHPAFRVALTSEQAALLARALGGGCETKTEFYASDLARCVAMTAEIKADEGDCNRKEEARVCGHTEQEDRDWYEDKVG